MFSIFTSAISANNRIPSFVDTAAQVPSVSLCLCIVRSRVNFSFESTTVSVGYRNPIEQA